MIDRQIPPQSLPEVLWGDRWRFASIMAGDITEVFSGRAIPIKHLPEEFFPLNLGISSTTAIPGTIVYGGRQSMQLARWLAERKPLSVTYVAAEVEAGGGLLLEADCRWILATFSDREVAEAAAIYEMRKKLSQGLHFLIVQPDDSGMTYSGFWLLRSLKEPPLAIVHED
jgi:RNA-binding protein Tab2/Atab2